MRAAASAISPSLFHMSTWLKKTNKHTSRQHIDGRSPVIFQLWFAPGRRDLFLRSGCFLVESRHAQADWSMWSIQGLLLAQDGRSSDTKIAKKKPQIVPQSLNIYTARLSSARVRGRVRQGSRAAAGFM